MNRLLVTAIIAASTFTFPTEADADHQRAIRKSYEAGRRAVQDEYRRQRRVLKHEYELQRDHLRAERDRARDIHCPETRARQVRAINREIAATAREYAARNRAIAAWRRDRKAELRHAYESARREARYSSSVSIHEDFAPFGHAVGSESSLCHSEAGIREPLVYDELGYVPIGGVEPYGPVSRPVVHRRKPTALDIAELVFSLIR